MKILSSEDVYQAIQKLNPKRKYAAMYSSLFDGIVTDPALMFVPIDDHIVHRGDGVFEAIRANSKKIFLLKEHIDRLYNSADRLSIKISKDKNQIIKICEEIRQTSKLDNCILRLFVSRGPGDFSPNPYSTLGSQIYIVATEFKPIDKEKYEHGVSVMVSSVETKSPEFAQIKSCNYLPNVLMKKESIDKGYDFAVGLNSEGYITEGPTENIMILNSENNLLAPKFDYTLKGTTLLRVMELAHELQQTKLINEIKFADIALNDFLSAKEIMMVGTTLGVLPVTQFQKTKISDGRAGPVAQKLLSLLNHDMGV